VLQVGGAVNVPVTGMLSEATTTVNAVQGTVTPAVPYFNARAGGTNYHVLFQALTPSGLNPALLNPGETSTGRIYFDITGPAPTEVVYTDAVQDRLVWNA
jgi:hypothetical protein